MVDEAIELQDEFGEKIRKRLAFEKSSQIEEYKAEQEKKKKKVEEEFDEDSFKPRIPKDIIW